jgi:hypothetical protein
VQFKLYAGNTFLLLSGGNTVLIYFHETLIHERILPGLIFAQNALGKMRISSLVYGIVCIKSRITYITNEVLTSIHDCRFDVYAFELDTPRQLAACKLYGTFCSACPPVSIFTNGETVL